MTRNTSARLGLACILACVAWSAPVAAQEGVAIKNLLGSMGIIPTDRDPIRYRERAPLVLPPKVELREPMPSSLATADPQWPNDPDVTAKRRQSAEQRRPVTESETRRMMDFNPRLSVQELAAGRTDRREASLPPRPVGDRFGVVLTPDELRAMGKSKGDDVASVGDEPNRRTLTDPPTGMRRSARGRDVRASFDPKIDQQEADANPLTWIRRKFDSSDDD